MSKDSTVKLASFLESVIVAMREWLGFNFESFDTWMVSYYVDNIAPLLTDAH